MSSHKPIRAEDWTPEKEAAYRAQYPHWSQYNSLDAAMERVMSDIETLAETNMTVADLIKKQGERIAMLEHMLREPELFERTSEGVYMKQGSERIKVL